MTATKHPTEVIIANTTTDCGLVPWPTCEGERRMLMKNLANEHGVEMFARDPVTDAVLGRAKPTLQHNIDRRPSWRRHGEKKRYVPKHCR